MVIFLSAGSDIIRQRRSWLRWTRDARQPAHLLGRVGTEDLAARRAGRAGGPPTWHEPVNQFRNAGGILTGLNRLYGLDAAAVILNAHVADLANELAARPLTVEVRVHEHLIPRCSCSSVQTFSRPLTTTVGGPQCPTRAPIPCTCANICGHTCLGRSSNSSLAGGHGATSTKHTHTHLLLAAGCGWYEALHLNAGQLPVRPDGRVVES